MEEAGRVYAAGVHVVVGQTNHEQSFREFILRFRIKETTIYETQLAENVRANRFYISVRIQDITAFDNQLSNALVKEPLRVIPFFSAAATTIANDKKDKDAPRVEYIQILLRSFDKPIPLRSLGVNHLNKLVVISGIVVSASKKQAKATEITVRCRNCYNQQSLTCSPGFGGCDIPVQCDGLTNQQAGAAPRQRPPRLDKCPPDPFMIMGDQCKFQDHQTIKLQEDPETIPTGEMPRQIILSVERNLVGRATPGARVQVVGIYNVYNVARSESKEQRPPTYFRVVGIHSENIGKIEAHFSRDEEAKWQNFSKRENLYEELAKSIAPGVYGHDDIKKALVCQLFAGSRRHLPDGITTRGDINILLLGDPGTAKSQLLKFVEKIAPIGVYTSGKGSSAAGLTASVIKDKHSKEFILEGGAMVLADGGIVCIDEFDKMRLQDRVAIHEAMEQQTISIAKAGITTILNSRTAVLAAANPTFGKFDASLPTFQNIDFQTTIMSRFDLIFLIKDSGNPDHDRRVAAHVTELHTKNFELEEPSELKLEDLKRYIAYCRSKCLPRLSDDASIKLTNQFVEVRSTVRKQTESNKKDVIPITVRQLEALIRLTEAQAKITLGETATNTHAEEALRLFKVSSLEAALSGISLSETLSPEVFKQVQAAETLIQRKLAIGSSISEKQFVADLKTANKIPEFVVRRAIDNLINTNRLEYVQQRKVLYRRT